MNIVWTPSAWEDYLYWQQLDKEKVTKINELIKDSKRSPFAGIGKPEPLKGNLKGAWSRRINQEHRFVYKVVENTIVILQCRFHY